MPSGCLAIARLVSQFSNSWCLSSCISGICLVHDLFERERDLCARILSYVYHSLLFAETTLPAFSVSPDNAEGVGSAAQPRSAWLARSCLGSIRRRLVAGLPRFRLLRAASALCVLGRALLNLRAAGNAPSRVLWALEGVVSGPHHRAVAGRLHPLSERGHNRSRDRGRDCR